MKKFYYVEKLDNELCDVTIYGSAKVYKCEHGNEYDVDEYTLYSVPYYPEIEQNIREHFSAWKAHAIAFTKQRDLMVRAITTLQNDIHKDKKVEILTHLLEKSRKRILNHKTRRLQQRKRQ